MAKKTPKQTALNYILESMAEVQSNFELSDVPENVMANAEAMLKLTEAYVKVETIDNLGESLKTLTANL